MGILEPRLASLVTLLIVMGAILYQTRRARSGAKISLRPIPGLQAVDEAIGRATEMGRPVHFTPGIAGLNVSTAPQALAGLAVLSQVAQTAGRMGTRTIATVSQPEMLPLADDTLRQGLTAVSRSELYRPDDVRFISTDQWAYASGAIGIMAREKVAANIMIGQFAAESLLLAEAGARLGAVQIAGTTNLFQIPFFIAACDYTLIGEEIYAGGAYFSKDPHQLGSLRAQDMAKIVGISLLLAGVVARLLGMDFVNAMVKL
jgi:hypothetical protein